MAHQHAASHNMPSMADSEHSSDVRVFATQLTALNSSGVKGAAVLTLDDHVLTVDIRATGLEADKVHVQHIHGFTDNTDSMSPTIAQDTDHDGFVELAEGLPKYGPILLNLTSPPTDAAETGMGTFAGTGDLMNFPTAPDGTIRFHQTYTFDSEEDAAQALFKTIQNLDNKEIVLHGLTVSGDYGDGTGGEVDGTAGYKAVLPVASGEIEEITGTAEADIAMARLKMWQDEMASDGGGHSHDDMGHDMGAMDHAMGHA